MSDSKLIPKPASDDPAERPARPGKTLPFDMPSRSTPAAFVVPYESIDGNDAPPPPPRTIDEPPPQVYPDEVPPVVATKRKRPSDDEVTTRVPVLTDELLTGELSAVPTHTLPATETSGAPAAEGSEDGEGGPSVIVDGPSEEYAAPDADRCPYCLTFVGIASARTRGVRYCPLCGADWKSLDRAVEAPSDAVVLLDAEMPAPMEEDALEDFPTNQFTRVGGPVRDASTVVTVPDPPEEQSTPTSPWLMLLVGITLGLLGTMTVAGLLDDGSDPVVVSSGEKGATAEGGPAAIKAGAPAAVEGDPAPAEPVEPPPTEPVEPPPTEPVEPPPTEPVEPPPTEPVEPPEPSISIDDVQAALIDTTSLLPPSAKVEITPRIDRDIVFLTGLVDGTETLGTVIEAVAAVDGVRAVDSRGVKAAWKVHVVVRGDTLSKIAQIHYGDTNLWPRIFNANRAVVTRPEQVIPGMKLRIPLTDQP